MYETLNARIQAISGCKNQWSRVALQDNISFKINRTTCRNRRNNLKQTARKTAINDQTDNQEVERYAIRDFADKNANPTLGNDAHENESTVKG